MTFSAEVTTKDNSTFKFLLDILDAFGKRKLELSGQFYAAILAEGARMGGLEKRIASLIVQGRTDASARGLNVEEPAAVLKPTRPVSWAELVENYAELKDTLGEISLPPVRVQVNGSEIRQVLYSERGVSYNQRVAKAKQSRETSIR